MKKYFVMLMLLPMTLGAQTLLDVRPAHEDGKVLTMEDANTNAAVFPARLSEMPAEFKRAARPELLAVPKGGSLYYRP